MGDYYCEICGETIELKNKKKHLNTKSCFYLSLYLTNVL